MLSILRALFQHHHLDDPAISLCLDYKDSVGRIKTLTSSALGGSLVEPLSCINTAKL